MVIERTDETSGQGIVEHMARAAVVLGILDARCLADPQIAGEPDGERG